MTVSSETTRVEHIGNGATAAFAIPFYFIDDVDIQVRLVNVVSGAVTTWTNPTNYSVSSKTMSGAVLNAVVAPPAGYELIIYRDPKRLQQTDFVEYDKFPAESAEKAHDRAVMVAQRAYEISMRSIHLPDSDHLAVVPSMEMVSIANRAGKYLGFDGNGGLAYMPGTSSGIDISANTSLSTGSLWARSMAARGADVINVLDFGALSGGGDDTVMIRAAFAAAKVKHDAGKPCIVWFPPNSYALTSAIINEGSPFILTVETHIFAHGAFIQQLPLAAHDGSSIFDVQAGRVEWHGGTITGNCTTQPADGFDNSWGSGAFGTGHSYRAAIKGDGNNHPNLESLKVHDVSFTRVYGACVAVRDIIRVEIHECHSESCYMGLLWQDYVASQTTFVKAYRNTAKNLGAAAAVHPNMIYSKNALYSNITDNIAQAVEGSVVRVVGGTDAMVARNQGESCGGATEPAIAIDSSAIAQNRVSILDNSMYSCVAGISILGANVNTAIIANNRAYTIWGYDALFVEKCLVLVINGNHFHDVQRHGMDIRGNVQFARITNNFCYGRAAANSYGMTFKADTGNWVYTDITNNTLHNFENSAGGLGTMNFQRTGGNVFTTLNVKANTVDAGGSGNWAMRMTGAIATLAFFNENFFNGKAEGGIAGPFGQYRNNNTTGAWTLPANTGNIVTDGRYQTTIGAAGGAAALPATPVGYTRVNVNNAEYVVPYYNP